MGKIVLHKIAFVVATKDRPCDLRKMLQSLSEQSQRPDQIVIVDSSRHSVRAIIEEFKGLNIKYIYHHPPSASKQRNVGIANVDRECELIAFLDDDAILMPKALDNMLKFWKQAPIDVGGCAFNWMNFIRPEASILKNSSFAEFIGLYSCRKGRVMPSGWQTLVGTVSEPIFVEWLPSGASVWRKQVFKQYKFDEYFDGYSYLEDLDFSYSVGKKYKLAIVADAGFCHYPSLTGKGGGYLFGKNEVINRLFFVRKHNLSVSKCYLGIIIRLFMTIGTFCINRERFHFDRFVGNIVSLLLSLCGKL
jgi:glycosyltransferase involved in cell wall biosynthesis